MKKKVGLMRHAVQCHPNVLALALGCLLAFLLLAGMEGFFRARLWLRAAPGEGPAKSNFSRIVEPDSRLAFRGKPSSTLIETLTRGGKTIYQAEYHLDAESRRRTWCPEEDAPACTALFLGCSVTFGTGVLDEETMPSRFCLHQPGYQALNAGFTGYGLQQVWLQLANPDFLQRLPSERGIVVYTFIDDHLNRLEGTPAVLTGWNYALPWLEAEEDGRILHQGNFANRDPLRYFLYRHGGRMHLFRFLERRLSGVLPTSYIPTTTITLAARIIEDAARRLEEIRPDFRFWVLLFPEAALGAALKMEVDETLVNILDCQDLLRGDARSRDELWYKDSAAVEWGHPKAPVYDLVARHMAENIPACQ